MEPGQRLVNAAGEPVMGIDPSGNAQFMKTDAGGALAQSPLPAGAVNVGAAAVGTSGVVTATIAGVASKTNYITGFTVTEKNPTAAADITVTLTGVVGGTKTYTISTLATAATVPNPPPLVVLFDPPLAATGVNTAIAVSASAAGAGGVANVNVEGIQI